MLVEVSLENAPNAFKINPFLANTPILYRRKTTEDQTCFQGGVKWEHWPEIGSKRMNDMNVARYKKLVH